LVRSFARLESREIGDGCGARETTNNLFTDDWREGVFGEIPYLNPAIPFGTLELTRKRESKGMLA